MQIAALGVCTVGPATGADPHDGVHGPKGEPPQRQNRHQSDFCTSESGSHVFAKIPLARPVEAPRAQSSGALRSELPELPTEWSTATAREPRRLPRMSGSVRRSPKLGVDVCSLVF